ncbi:MAG: hypothetical protein WCX90_04865 [Thiohalomonadaceae bacterium]
MSEESTVPEAETSAVVEVAQEQSELEEQDLQRLLDEARKMADEHWNHVLRLQAELEMVAAGPRGMWKMLINMPWNDLPLSYYRCATVSNWRWRRSVPTVHWINCVKEPT